MPSLLCSSAKANGLVSTFTHLSTAVLLLAKKKCIGRRSTNPFNMNDGIRQVEKLSDNLPAVAKYDERLSSHEGIRNICSYVFIVYTPSNFGHEKSAPVLCSDCFCHYITGTERGPAWPPCG
jgi:hypothetical protein